MLHRIALSVAMCSAVRTAARPPEQNRLPNHLPLSRGKVANPANAAAVLPLSVPRFRGWLRPPQRARFGCTATDRRQSSPWTRRRQDTTWFCFLLRRLREKSGFLRTAKRSIFSSGDTLPCECGIAKASQATVRVRPICQRRPLLRDGLRSTEGRTGSTLALCGGCLSRSN